MLLTKIIWLVNRVVREKMGLQAGVGVMALVEPAAATS